METTAAPATATDQDTLAREEPLRALTTTDWGVAAAIGAVTGAATFATSAPWVPAALLPAIVILAVGLGVLAHLDHVTRLIRNRHIAVLALAEIPALGYAAAAGATGALGGSIVVPALVGAVAMFVFMLALTVATGFAGGGDIKLSPVPGAVLAAINPLAALMWLLVTFTGCLVGMAAVRLSRSGATHAAMGPYMALALPVAVPLAGWMTAVATGGLA